MAIDPLVHGDTQSSMQNSEADLLLPGGASILSSQRACSAPTPEPERTMRGLAAPGSKVLLEGKYLLDGELGRGGMGRVFKAVDESLGRRVAIKFLLPEHQSNPIAVDRFRREARAMAAVHHENVVRIYTFDKHCSVDFFVMELINGTTARDLLLACRSKRGARNLPLNQAVSIVDQACAGLAAVHDAGMAHRDIKPANLMIEEHTQRVVIMDFGLGRTKKAAADPRRVRLEGGTAGYLAPEVIEGRSLESWEEVLVDIYALGVTAFELITGRHLFEAENGAQLLERHLTEEPPPPSALRPEVPPALDELVLSCLAKDPARRFQWCSELRGAIQPLLSMTSPNSVVPTINPPPAPRPAPLRRVEKTALKRARVVFAGDDETHRMTAHGVVRHTLGENTFETVRSVPKALEMLRDTPPTVLIASLNGASLNGLELAATVLNEPAYERIALIVTARRVTEQDKSLLERMGVVRVLDEPLDPEALEQAIEAALSACDGRSWSRRRDFTAKVRRVDP